MSLKNAKKSDNFLLYVPRKKHNTWEIDKGQVKLIFHHDKVVERFMRWLVKKSRLSDVLLDDISSMTWILIDGKNNVYEINEKLVENFGDRCDINNNSLIMFLRYLNRKGWISFEKGNQ